MCSTAVRWSERKSDKYCNIYSEKEKIFEIFLHGKFATNICFQKSLRPGRTMQKSRQLLIGKRISHDYKFECSMLPIGLPAKYRKIFRR